MHPRGSPCSLCLFILPDDEPRPAPHAIPLHHRPTTRASSSWFAGQRSMRAVISGNSGSWSGPCTRTSWLLCSTDRSAAAAARGEAALWPRSFAAGSCHGSGKPWSSSLAGRKLWKRLAEALLERPPPRLPPRRRERRRRRPRGQLRRPGGSCSGKRCWTSRC